MKKELESERVPTETQEQAALLQWWRGGGRRSLGLPRHALFFAIPNGANKSPAMAAKFQREGLLAGIPDLCLAWAAGDRHGLFIEMKRRRGGRVSAAQTVAMAALEAAGYACAVCRGWNEAADAISAYVKGGSHD